MFMGSGYSDNPAPEGKTFFVLDPLNGNIIRDFEIPDGTPAPPPAAIPPALPDPVLTNFLVAPPVYYAEDPETGKSPSSFNFIGNLMTAKVKTVYFGDLHGRIWRYDATSPDAPPAIFFAANAAAAGNQPFATGVSISKDSDDPGDVLVYAEAGRDRRVTPQAAKPFKAYAWRDVNGVRTDLFVQNLPTGYRGTVQPATAFTSADSPVVFFGGVRYTGGCISVFDSILYALKGVSSTLTADAAFDLRHDDASDDAFIQIQGNKINSVSVQDGNLVIDRAIHADAAPPPPGVRPPANLVTLGGNAMVAMGLVPKSRAYMDLSATAAPFPYRIGSSVCRTEP